MNHSHAKRLGLHARKHSDQPACRKGAGLLLEQMEQRVLLAAAVNGALAASDVGGVSGQLLNLAANPHGAVSASNPLSFMYDSADRVAVRITATDVAALAAPLATIGFTTVASEPSLHFVDGYLPIDSITTLEKLTDQGLKGALPIYRPMTGVGNVNDQGDFNLEADRARASLGTTGAGVTVGVLSDSYNNLGGAANDITSNDLPAGGVTYLEDLGGGGADEGRAMLQIVHDLAPGSNLAFATAFNSEADFAQNIQDLAKPVVNGGAGASIIVDDVFYFDEPFFQDGVIAQAINTVVTNNNVSYFSLAGNLDTQAYESTSAAYFSDTIPTISASAATYYDFDPSIAAVDKQTFSLNANQAVILSLQWNQPYYTVSGVTSNLGIYILDHTTGAVVASSTADAIANQTPNQIVGFTNGASVKSYDVVIRSLAGAPPSRVKYVNYGANNYGDVTFAFATNSPTLIPHSAAANAMSVAADSFYNQRNPESYTSRGPATILFTANGTPQTAQVRAKPDIAAIDGADTTFFGSDIDSNGFKNFFGTSAAAPHAAAIGALIKAVHPTFTPAQIYAALVSSADPNIGGSPGSPTIIGAGLIDAYTALNGAPAAASLAVSDGFEAGFAGNAWQIYNSGAGQTNVTSSFSPSSGSYHLVQAGNLNGFVIANLSEAILHTNLASAAAATLSFSWKNFYNGGETTQVMPTSFTGHGNYDGVSISVDGITWYKALQFTVSPGNTTYQTFTINLSSVATANAITLGADTRIKFQHYDPNVFPAGTAGFAYDNISVTNPLNLSGPAFYVKLNADLLHLDIWANSTGTGGVSQSPLVASITSLNVTGTGASESLTFDFNNGKAAPSGGATYTAGVTASQLTIIGNNSGNTANVNGSTITFSGTFGTSPIGYSGVGALAINGGNGVDTVTQSAQPGGTATLAFAGGTGADVFNINAGTHAFTSDVFPATNALSINVAGTSAVTFNSAQHMASLNVSGGTASIVAGGGQKTLVTKAISVTGAGQLDLADHSMVVDWTGTSPIGSWTGSVYTGVTGLLATGRNGGAWTGNGIRSSSIGSSLNALGTAEASQVLGITGTQTATFVGQTVDASSVLVKYTYAGDANLDGKINVDDYTRIDFNVALGTKGWYNGDFNYDGKINVDDYTIIDFNVGIQGPPINTASDGSAGGTGQASVFSNFTANPDTASAVSGKRDLDWLFPAV